jgi:hypothetical protein
MNETKWSVIRLRPKGWVQKIVGTLPTNLDKGINKSWLKFWQIESSFVIGSLCFKKCQSWGHSHRVNNIRTRAMVAFRCSPMFIGCWVSYSDVNKKWRHSGPSVIKHFGEYIKFCTCTFSAHQINVELLQMSPTLPQPTRFHFVSTKPLLSSFTT